MDPLLKRLQDQLGGMVVQILQQQLVIEQLQAELDVLRKQEPETK